MQRAILRVEITSQRIIHFKSLTLRQIRDLNVESGSCVPHNIMNRMINKSRSELFSFSRKPPTHILIYELPHVVALCFFICTGTEQPSNLERTPFNNNSWVELIRNHLQKSVRAWLSVGVDERGAEGRVVAAR